MGGKSKSRTSSTNTTTDITTTTADNRVSYGDGVIEGNIQLSNLDGSNVTVEKTDHGAIQQAGNLASQSIGGVVEVSGSAFDFGSEALAANIDVSDEAFEFGESAIAANNDLAFETIRNTEATFDSAIAAVLDNDELNNQLIRQSLDYNQALIRQGNQSETANFSDQLFEKILPISLVVGGVYIAGKFIAR